MGSEKSIKPQVGVYLSAVCKSLLVNLAVATGMTKSQVVEQALREYAYHHREEIRFNLDLRDQYGHKF